MYAWLQERYTHTARDTGANTTHGYLCISLQHHPNGHSLNYKHQLHYCSNLIVLILFQYIPHCPRVWVQFHDQSRHSCSRLLLHHRIIHNYCEFIFSDDIAGTKWRESKLSACHFSIIGPPVVITHCSPLSLIAHLHPALLRSESTS